MDVLEKQVNFFNIFKETARNNIGIIHGFPSWVNKMAFTIENNDLLIHIPPALIKYGTSERISHSRRKKEIDKIMGMENYTFLEFLIKNSCIIYASVLEKEVTNFYKRGN